MAKQLNTVKGNRQLTKANYEILCALMTGKYLRASFSLEQRLKMRKDTGFTNVSPTVSKLEAMGVIVGYVPILSPDGRKILEAMRLIYGDAKQGKQIDVEEVLEEM